MLSKKPSKPRKIKIVFTAGKKNSKYTNALQSERGMIFYNLLDQTLKQAGVSAKLYKTSLPFYDNDKKCFTEYWQHDTGTVWKKYKKNIKPDLIIDRSGKVDFSHYKSLAIITLGQTTLLRTLIKNKYTQYLLLPDLMPYTILINDEQELIQKINLIKTEKKVIKPIFGQGGKDIIIGNRSTIFRHKKDFNYPCCLQEFITTKEKNVSDIRAVIYKNKPLYYIKREAPNNSLLTNLLQGATVASIPAKEIPSTIKNIVKNINKKFSDFPDTLYSIDFLVDYKGKPKLIEINGNPGPAIAIASGDKQAVDLHLKAMVEMIKNKIASI